jgi:GNAT superfamily N-acetyltransferase
VSVQVRPVRSLRDKREFVELPFRLHSSSPHWVPPLRLQVHLFLTPRLNSFFRQGEVQLFLARRGDRTVGRISAHIDRPFNAYQDNRWGLFGFLELEDDPEVAEALFDAAQAWLQARGRDRMVGPMSFRMNDESGVLVEGHELDPIVGQPWNPPSYQRLVEGAGLEKVVDTYMWQVLMDDRNEMLPVLTRLARDLEPKHGITIRRMSRRRLRADLDVFAEIYNHAWRRNWGFVPYSKADLDDYAQELQLVFDRDFYMVAEDREGTPVAMAISVPDVNQVLKGMGGRLLPLGWWRFLRRARVIKRVRIGFLGVKPEYQHTGVAAALYVEHFDTGMRVGIMEGEAGWILETNRAMNRGMEAMHARISKRLRMYERRWEPGAEPAMPKGAAPAEAARPT